MKSELLRILRYGITGGISTFLHIAIVILLVELTGLDPLVASLPAFCGASVAGFIINRTWVFGSTDKMERQFFLFFVAALIGLAINMAGMYAGTRVLNTPYVIALGASILVASTTTYLINRLFTFRRKI